MSSHLSTNPYKSTLIRQRSLQLLDYPAVISDISNFTTFNKSKFKLLSMQPSYFEDEVTELLQKTSEGRFLLEHEGNLSCASITEIDDILRHASLGGSLTGEELLSVSNTQDIILSFKKILSQHEERCPRLSQLANQISNVSYLTYSIASKLTPNGLVKDNATPNLGSIRKQVRQAYDRVTNSLRKIIEINQLTGVIQDDVISVRGDRLVLQIKSNMRSKIPGVIHDVSNTHQTLFVEPFTTVNLCNAWRELILEEAQEVEKVLKELSESIGKESSNLQNNIDIATELDFILSKSRYSNHIAAPIPIIENSNQPDERSISIVKGKHPLLSNDAVPLSIDVGPNWKTLVITGPNTGGKTVALKTIGLLALLNQSGIHIPASVESSLPVFNGVYADIGDQQSLQQSVSSFSSHINSLNEIIEFSDNNSLVILDEIGSSTNPEEGTAIAIAVIEYLAERKVNTLVATHHMAVAAHAELSPLMKNASFTLHPDTLEPTYQITMDIPGGSFAMTVAERLGLNSNILKLAEKYLPQNNKNISNILEEIRKTREAQAAITNEIQQELLQSSNLRKKLQQEIKYLNDHKLEIVRSFHDSAKTKYEEVEKILGMARSALSWAKNPGTQYQGNNTIEKKLDSIAEQLVENPLPDAEFDIKSYQSVNLDDSVIINDLGLTGTVTSIERNNDDIEVMVGNVRLVVNKNRLTSIQNPSTNTKSGIDSSSVVYPVPTGQLELDIRGMRSEEALIHLEQFLDDSVRAGLSKVRVIHGKGTGALRFAARNMLNNHPLVSRYEPETDMSGGDGSTSVLLN